MGQHTVPQKYLSGFSISDDETKIWLYEKKRQEFSDSPVAIKKVAQQKNFYSSEDERLLAKKVELPANKIIERIRNGLPLAELTEEDRAHISIYMGTMMKRVPEHRSRAERLMPEVLRSVVADTKEMLFKACSALDGTPNENSAWLLDQLTTVNELHEKYENEPPPEALKNAYSPWPNDNVINAIFQHHWYLIESEGPSFFVTNDNPVFMVHEYGLGHPESELTFPISPRLALFGTRRFRTNDRKATISQKLVKEANRRIIKNATRLIFCDRKYDWVKKVAAKKEPHLSLIRPD